MTENRTETAERDRAPEEFAAEPEQREERGLAAPVASGPRVQVMPPADERQGRMTDVRVIVRHSVEVDKLFAAMAKAQGAFGDVHRTLQAKIDSKRTGSSYTIKYESLADVIDATTPALSENEIAVFQFPFPGQSTMVLRTLLGHSSGQWIYNDLTCALEGGLDAKSVGGGISYLMRYARKAILGIGVGWPDIEQPDRPSSTEPPRPAQRQSAPKPEPARPVPAVVASDGLIRSTGKIADYGERGGATYVALDNGFKCATRDGVLIAHLVGHRKANRTITLVCKPASDPKKYVSTLAGIEAAEA